MKSNGSSKAQPTTPGTPRAPEPAAPAHLQLGNQTEPAALVIVEPSSLLREGLSRLLEGCRYKITGSGPSLSGITPTDHMADAILIGGDDASILRTLEECRAAHPTARRVVLYSGNKEHLNAIFNAGAHACLGRDISLRALVMTMDLALLGAKIVCDPSHGDHVASGSIIPGEPSTVATGIANNLTFASNGTGGPSNGKAAQPVMDEVAHRLSMREVAILECLMHGDSNKLIAKRFQIAEATVKVHIKAILRKIRAANRTQAAIWAMGHLPTHETQRAGAA